MADDQSSIPSVVDGLKPVQRKILLCALKNPKKLYEVKKFIGYVSEHSAYRDRKQNLATTMTGMAQNYVGSNNINLLYPMCTRSRYTYTELSSITPYLFHESDEPLLKYLNEDGKSIEPNWLMPIIPMVLVNGSEGIGTNYNPSDIIANIRRLLNGEELVPMDPWYKWFKGTILRITATSYTTLGVVEERKYAPNRLFITELPIGKLAEDYEEFLKAAAKEPFIEEYIAHHYDNGTVIFEVVMSPDQMNKARQEGFLNKFKLTTNLNTSNMRLVDEKSVIKKYGRPEAILEEFFHLRLEYYEIRKSAVLAELEKALSQLENKVKFIQEVLAGTINLFQRAKQQLEDKGYAAFPEKAVLEASEEETSELVVEEKHVSKTIPGTEYDYLLCMGIGMYTHENLNQLRAERDAKIVERGPSAKDLWFQDLGALEVQLDKPYDDEDEAQMRNKWIPVSDFEIE